VLGNRRSQSHNKTTKLTILAQIASLACNLDVVAQEIGLQ